MTGPIAKLRKALDGEWQPGPPTDNAKLATVETLASALHEAKFQCCGNDVCHPASDDTGPAAAIFAHLPEPPSVAGLDVGDVVESFADIHTAAIAGIEAGIHRGAVEWRHSLLNISHAAERAAARYAALAGTEAAQGARPPVVCLCGSTRFVETFNEWRVKETLAGKIVLSIELVTTQSREQDPQHVDPARKAMLDELHLRKIDLADEVLFLNVGGYMGESTRRELAYAQAHGKALRFLEPATAAPEADR